MKEVAGWIRLMSRSRAGQCTSGCNDIPCVLGDANGEPVFDEDGRIMGVIPVAGNMGYNAECSGSCCQRPLGLWTSLGERTLR